MKLTLTTPPVCVGFNSDVVWHKRAAACVKLSVSLYSQCQLLSSDLSGDKAILSRILLVKYHTFFFPTVGGSCFCHYYMYESLIKCSKMTSHLVDKFKINPWLHGKSNITSDFHKTWLRTLDQFTFKPKKKNAAHSWYDLFWFFF